MNIKKLLIFLLFIGCGLIPSAWLLQNDARVQRWGLQTTLGVLESLWDASIVVEQATLDFFTGEAYLKNGIIKPKNSNGSSWRFNTCQLSFSLFNLITEQKVAVKADFDSFIIDSNITNNALAISHHFKQILDSRPTFPDFQLTHLHINRLKLDAAQGLTHYHLNLAGNITFEKLTGAISNTWHGKSDFINGDLTIDDKSLIQQIAGTWKLVYEVEKEKLTSNLELFFKSARNNEVIYTLSGTSGLVQGLFSLSSSDQLTNITLEKKNNTSTFKGTLAKNAATILVHELTSFPLVFNDNDSDKSMKIQFSFDHNSNTLNGTLESNQVTLASMFDASVSCDVLLNNSHLTLDTRALCNDSLFDIHLTFDRNTQSISAQAFNSQTYRHTPTRTQFSPYSLRLTLTGHPATHLHANFQAQAERTTNKVPFSCSGVLDVDNETIKAQGHAKQGPFQCTIQRNPLKLISANYHTQSNTPLIELKQGKNPNVVAGKVQYSLLKTLLPETITRYVLGDKGTFHIQVNQKDTLHPRGKLAYLDGSLYLNGSLNLINTFKSSFDLDIEKKKLVCKNNRVKLHKGELYSPQICICWNNAFALESLHAPVNLRKTLVNWKHDFYGIVDGTFLAQKKKNGPVKTDSNIMLRKGLLKDNIFSQFTNKNDGSFTQSYLAQQLLGDIKLQTDHPLRVDTPFLRSNVHIDLGIVLDQAPGQPMEPKMTGNIRLENGYLQFTHDKLWIKEGIIKCIPNNLNQAIIDITASNKIKKYHVTLHATGSVEKPNIELTSIPYLSQEQLVALLFSGSENASLQADLPIILMQNLDRVLVGNKQTQPKARSFFQTLSKSFKYLQITPQFTDQSGRGGIRGTLNIELNDQFHARFEKNFNLLEDFVVQLEYFLSQDFNIKMTRDARGDLGSEIEFRFKV